MNGNIRLARPITVSTPVRWSLITAALGFLVLFLFIPLAAVFVYAFRNGWETYLAAVVEPDAAEAIRLTLSTAAIAVGFNLVFGVMAAWAIAKFEFIGKIF